MADQQPRLTPRQREVLEQLARGRTNPEIAAALGIGFETVKMHVSDVLAELHVSSREEAADWWRRSRRPAARMRALIPAAAALRWAAGGVLATGATAGVALFVVAASGDGGPVSPADQATSATPTSSAAEPTPTSIAQPPPSQPTNQVDVGWEAAAAALRVRLLDFRADALHTEVTLEIEGSMRETGDAQVYVTDSAGQRQRLQGAADRDANGARTGTYSGFTLSLEAGTVLIEVSPVRDYVIPALAAADPLPVWARFEFPWQGYTDAARLVPLPADASRPIGRATASLEQIIVTSTTVRIDWKVENGELLKGNPTLWVETAAFLPDGTPIYGPGGGGGTLWTVSTMKGYWMFPAAAEQVIFVLVGVPYPVCPQPTPAAGRSETCDLSDWRPMPSNLEDIRKGEFEFTEFQVDLR